MINNVFQTGSLSSSIRNGLAKLGFTDPTPVQTAVIPKLLKNKNLVVQATTGSGKTHAFLVPAFNRLQPNSVNTQVIITAPSRELAEQLDKNARDLREASGLNCQIDLAIGGQDRERQIERLKHRQPDILIGTPGRLKDFIEKKYVDLQQVSLFIIDEADMTLDMGFLRDVDDIASRMPPDVTIGVFSATIPAKLKPFLNKYMEKPEYVLIDNPTVISPLVSNWLIDVGSKDKKKYLYQLLTIGQPYLALIFANTKMEVDELHRFLTNQGLTVAKIHGDISARDRKKVMRQVQELKFQYIVATDLAARGIDIEGISLVVNYNLPSDNEFFIHRVGRTGRNNLPGTAVTLIYHDELNQIAELEHMGIEFENKTIRDGEIVDVRGHNLRENRQASTTKLDTKMVGLVKKEKKKRKPGYKKKIKRAIARDNQQKRKIEQRHELRTKRKARKNSN